MKYIESETVELKKSLSELKEGIISIVSILNKHQKGELFFGIDKFGKECKQEINEKTLRDISQVIANNIEPKIYPVIEKKGNIIKIRFEGKETPYFAYGRSYIRTADEDKKMSSKELENLILKKNKDKIRWDNEICENASLDDIDEERLKWFLEESGKEFDSLKSSLEKLNLIKHNKLLNSAILLFGKNPENFFNNARLRCAVFGTEDTTISIDMQEFEGNLFSLIQTAEKYFLKNIHIGMKINGLRRIDVPEINKEAFREGLINAYCHRDYFNPDSVHLAIFKDRVEIRSPGLLFSGLTIEKIRTEKVSERRNEFIAQMFHMIHFVENWGKGISKILKLEPQTEFKELGRKFYAIFKRKSNEPQNEPQNEPLNSKERVYNFIKNNPGCKRQDIVKNIGFSLAKVKRILSGLRARVERKGSDKTGGYFVRN